jgi:hypothetical protein
MRDEHGQRSRQRARRPEHVQRQRSRGQRRDEPQHQALVLSAVIGVTFFVLSMSARGFYARSLSADAETARLASAYLL